MEKYTAVNDPKNGNIKVASNGQVNSYPNTANGYEHIWYNPKTGVQGWHGENTSAEDKAFLAEISRR